MFKSSVLLFLLVSVVNCQFFYNYEEDRPEELQSEQQNYDQSAYQYNPPSTVNQQYLQPPSNENEPVNERGNRRTRIRVRSRNYQSEPDYNESSASNSDNDQRTIRQERRQARRRQRQNDYMMEPVAPPRIFGPSMFENIGLGEAPSGVYIPSDSFLNVLKNQRSVAPSIVSQPVAAVPQTTSYSQPSIDNTNSQLQPRFFVQPPSNDEPRNPNLILPVTRPTVAYVNAPQPQARVVPVRNSPDVQVQTGRGNRRSRPRMRIPAEPAAPTVDIDALREYRDDFAREDVMPQVQYAPVNTRPSSRSQSRRRTVTNYQETTPAPRVYSPSIFENVGLGEAPSGVFVPEDSLLNTLRNPSGQHLSHRISRREPPVLSVPQPAYSSPNEYEEEIVDEQYQPPPPPPPQRRPAPSRARQTPPPRRPQRQEYQNEYVQNPNVQPAQSSSQRRRGNDFEDFERQTLPVRQRTQSQRRPETLPASRTQSQPSSETSESAFRKAKLAIAELPEDADDDGIPGEAGVNYPTLHVVPKTSFSCTQQPHNGYYADLETSCQVVHLCQSGGVQSSFLCPNGTIFSQDKFSCQWWYKVNCNDAPKYYIKNDELYKVPEKKERKERKRN